MDPCRNVDPRLETEVATTLSEYERNAVALNDICLEKDKTYKFVITFHRQNRYEDNPSAQILIDSLTLIPRIEVTTLFNKRPEVDNIVDEYIRFSCNTTYYETNYDQKLNEKCKDLLNGISVVYYDGAKRKSEVNLVCINR